MNSLRLSARATALLHLANVSAPAAVEYSLLPNCSFEFWSKSAPEVIERKLASGPELG